MLKAITSIGTLVSAASPVTQVTATQENITSFINQVNTSGTTLNQNNQALLDKVKNSHFAKENNLNEINHEDIEGNIINLYNDKVDNFSFDEKVIIGRTLLSSDAFKSFIQNIGGSGVTAHDANQVASDSFISNIVTKTQLRVNSNNVNLNGQTGKSVESSTDKKTVFTFSNQDIADFYLSLLARDTGFVNFSNEIDEKISQVLNNQIDYQSALIDMGWSGYINQVYQKLNNSSINLIKSFSDFYNSLNRPETDTSFPAIVISPLGQYIYPNVYRTVARTYASHSSAIKRADEISFLTNLRNFIDNWNSQTGRLLSNISHNDSTRLTNGGEISNLMAFANQLLKYSNNLSSPVQIEINGSWSTGYSFGMKTGVDKSTPFTQLSGSDLNIRTVIFDGNLMAEDNYHYLPMNTI